VSARDDRTASAGRPGEEESFLSRWARLKRESAEQAALPSDVQGRPAKESASGEPLEPAQTDTGEAARTTVEEPDQPELPPIESLTEESDIGAFMRPGVDPSLRRLALKKMFRNPKYGVVDPLDPFRADFAAYTPLGDIITADMKFHAERLLRKQLEKAAEADGGAGIAEPVDGDSPGSGEGRAAAASPAGSPEAGEDAATQETRMEDGDERRDA
jgi:hypothetical protein